MTPSHFRQRRHSAPAFQYYPKDFLSDLNVLAMTLEERGAYWTLVSICWLSGAIPADINRLAKLLGVASDEMQKMWPAISPCFVADRRDNTLLRQPGLERQRRAQAEYRAKQAANGRLGGRPRKRPSVEERNPDIPTAFPHGSQPKAKSTPAPPSPSSSSSPSSSGAISPATSSRPTSRTAFEGNRIRVWRWQHEELARRLGAKTETFDLAAWYERLDHELVTTGESFADPWTWLQYRLVQDADLPVPSLGEQRKTGKTAGNLTALQRFASRRQA